MNKCSDMKCRRCGKAAHEIGGYLTRVNAKGVPGIWECRPNCQADLPSDVEADEVWPKRLNRIN